MNELGIIILAAGWGRRIGMSKALLPIDDTFYLHFILSKLQKLKIDKEIIAVINTDVDLYLKNNNIAINTVLNKNPDAGMSSSISLGINSLPKCKNYMIYPVDHPNVSIKTLEKLIISIDGEKKYYQPKMGDKSGHPIIISHKIIEEIFSKLTKPLNVLLKNYKRILINVDDEEITRNINYKKDIIIKS